MFIVAQFTIARTWKQPRYPLAGEWIRKLWYIYPMEYYSAIKRNAFQSVLIRWINLEPIIQSEVSQKEKNKYHILTHILGIQKDGNDEPIFREAGETQTQRTHMDTVGVWEEGEGEMYGENNVETYITICKIDSQQEFAV